MKASFRSALAPAAWWALAIGGSIIAWTLGFGYGNDRQIDFEVAHNIDGNFEAIGAPLALGFLFWGFVAAPCVFIAALLPLMLGERSGLLPHVIKKPVFAAVYSLRWWLVIPVFGIAFMRGIEEGINWTVPPVGMINPVLYQIALVIHRLW